MNDARPRRQALRSPLARKLIIAIVLFSSAITLVLTAVQLYVSYSHSLNDLHNDFRMTEVVHVRALTQSLWATNEKELKIQLDGLVEVPFVEYAEVRDSQKIWAKAGTRAAKSTIEKHFPLEYEHLGQRRRIGDLLIVADLDLLYSQLVDQAIVILLSNAIKTFLVGAFMFFFIHWLIVRHLQAFTGHLQHLNPADPGLKLALDRSANHRPDEMDQLAVALGQLQDRARTAIQDLMESERRLHSIADYTIDWENWVGPDGKLLWVNSSVERVTGYSAAEVMAMADFPISLIHPDDRESTMREFGVAVRGGTANNFEFRTIRKDGVVSWLAVSYQPLYGPNQEFLGHRSSVRIIDELKSVQADLQEKIDRLEQSELAQRNLVDQARQERARLVHLLSAMNLGILFEDIDHRVVYTNPAFRRIWLISDKQELTGQATRDVIALSANVLARPDHFSRHILQVIGTHEISETFEIEMADQRVVTQLSYAVRDPEGRYMGRLWVYEDVTRERQTAEQLIYLAERDSLTGLYNRHRFQEELARMLIEAERRDAKGALLFFDLDEFKYINDNFGHRAGDTMLIRVAGEVSALVRRNEVFARIGGDEFAILLPDATEAEAVRLGERVVRAISQIPFRFEGQNLRLTTSLGIALYPEHGANAEDLVAHADAAMYQAKDSGKNAWRVYRQDRDASREMLSRLSWNDRISRALENQLLELHFQGIYVTRTGKLSHVEALVRMRDETDANRIIMPGHFIPSAEKTGKIVDIDRWVIRTGIEMLSRTSEIPAMAVNISGRSFDEPTLPQYIAEQLAIYKVQPDRLLVELTETSAVTDLNDAQRFIEALRQTGCRVCLDDFGSGFSSFAYLKHLKADVLKIDGMFIRNLPNDYDNQVFVKSIADVARGMHKATIAEFVEDSDTLQMLTEMGVDMVQGYHLGMPAAELPPLELSGRAA